MARRGAPVAGGCGPLVRTREHRQEPRLRPLRRSAKPDVLRRRRGVAGHDGGRPGDEGRDPHVRREGRDRVLLLVVRRPHGLERGRLRAAAALPAVAARSLGHAVAVSPLGAAFVHPRLARSGVRPFGASRRRDRRADRIRAARVGHARQEDGPEDPAQGGRCSGAARVAVDRVQDRRPPRRASAVQPRRREHPSSCPGSRETSRRRSSRSWGQKAPGFRRSGSHRIRTAPSPSPYDPRSRLPTGSRPRGRQGLP